MTQPTASTTVASCASWLVPLIAAGSGNGSSSQRSEISQYALKLTLASQCKIRGRQRSSQFPGTSRPYGTLTG
jgi:hypothetical protein